MKMTGKWSPWRGFTLPCGVTTVLIWTGTGLSLVFSIAVLSWPHVGKQAQLTLKALIATVMTLPETVDEKRIELKSLDLIPVNLNLEEFTLQQS